MAQFFKNYYYYYNEKKTDVMVFGSSGPDMSHTVDLGTLYLI